MAGDPRKCPNCPYETRPMFYGFSERDPFFVGNDQSLVLYKLTDILRELQEIKELLKEKPLD